MSIRLFEPVDVGGAGIMSAQVARFSAEMFARYSLKAKFATV